MSDRYNVAIYCRLSREDGDSAESSSISSQKEILTEHANNNNWNIYQIYVDDGYSGGNFNRPGFNKLIEDIEKGNIDILITKDLSRLGRNYIQVGYYTEEYFPEHNVRYIAINDNYDSTSDDNDFTPFKNIINQWYLKDISKKVKSAHVARMKKGLLPGGKCLPLFGYKCTENSQREIDEPAAKIVKLIFELYLKGMLIVDIKRYLYQHKINTPSYYFYLKYGNRASKWELAKEDEKYIWASSTLNSILYNEEYTGTLILQKKKTISYKTHKTIKSSIEEQYKYENKFEPIISKEVFQKVLSLKKVKTKSQVDIKDNILNNYIICGNCGKAMSLQIINKDNNPRNKSDVFYCRSNNCNKHITVRVKEIEHIVTNEIQTIIKAILSNEETLKSYIKEHRKKTDINTSKHESEIVRLTNRNNKLNILVQKLFESSVSGLIPVESFNKIMSSYKNELENNTQEISLLKQQINNINNIDYEKELNDIVSFIRKHQYNQLDRDIIQCIIKKIIVSRDYQKQLQVEIIYNNVISVVDEYIHQK